MTHSHTGTKPLTATLLRRLLLQMLLLLACYSLSRLFFTLINLSHFQGLDLAGYLRLAVHALRFDLSAILALNALYMILLLLPLPVWKMPRWRMLLQVLFVTINLGGLLFELSDWAYFPYNFKRATADVLLMVGRQGDFWALLPQFLLDYWFVPLAVLLTGWLFIWLNARICRATPLRQPAGAKPARRISVQLGALLLMAGIFLLGIRGGLQYIPIGIRNAVQVTDSRYVPIVLNTPFSIIHSWASQELEVVQYMPEDSLEHYINPIRQYGAGPFRPKNVVVIILESFSKEFTGLGGLQSYTPFLDSLMAHSLVCTQAFANGLHSAEGVPSVLAGMPSLMEESVTTSAYGANKLTALPSVLKGKGYASAFYHGGTNGTMSFDVFCAAAGFEQYHGRSEYGREADYDGNWGIWDEPFLQYAATSMSQLQQPFVSSVFTLSSHPPFGLPRAARGRYPEGSLPIHPTIGYTDAALRRFFHTASRQPWYAHTLFVITADHSSPLSSGGYYSQGLGRYAIPMLFFAPADSSLKGRFDQPAQQLDILPSVLHYLGYEQPFFAYGNSVFDSSAHRYAITYINGSYQWLSDAYLLQSQEVNASGLYAYPADSLCANNLLQARPEAAGRQLRYLKAFIQSYRRALSTNRTWVEPGAAGSALK